ncbi:hypothetical protein CCH79_00019279 [Gambusia affinis]|uniref:Uncharacterized protein n=1 Tax=Gambusia affinis TaxID=33528 RepID=A0A315W990_GAMAF|nr:hypothetical protein CCH79_00019279 [Gambusia affinis]
MERLKQQPLCCRQQRYEAVTLRALSRSTNSLEVNHRDERPTAAAMTVNYRETLLSDPRLQPCMLDTCTDKGQWEGCMYAEEFWVVWKHTPSKTLAEDVFPKDSYSGTLYDWCQSLVRIAGSKSGSFPLANPTENGHTVRQCIREVFLRGLSKLLPRPSLYLSNLLGCKPLRRPVPISCSACHKGPLVLLLQPDGIPHRRCPPTGSRAAAVIGTDNLAATAPIGHLDNGGTEHGPLRLHLPHLSRDVFEVLLEMGVKTPSHRGFRQTFPADPHNTFGPARSDRHPPPPAEPTNYIQLNSVYWVAHFL